MKATLLLLACLAATGASYSFGAKLLHIQSLWRHGDRTPVGTYPTDPYQENAWPVPWGELTTRGMWQHYRQGLKLKEEYIDKYKLVSANYSINEVSLHESA
uniref:Lysosomal acid phosphatase n=1 Tax=Steinernema glaseri TaxID=37863 RepID=A0A1I7YXR6_9BILA